MDVVIQIVLTSVITGGITSVATVAAINVNISWLIKTTEKNEHAINRAHKQ